jgi:hypothetical protein
MAFLRNLYLLFNLMAICGARHVKIVMHVYHRHKYTFYTINSCTQILTNMATLQSLDKVRSLIKLNATVTSRLPAGTA